MKKILLILCFFASYSLSAQVIFEDGFEDDADTTTPGMQFKSEWTATPGMDGRIEIVKSTNVARTGQFGVLMGKTSDGEFATNTLDLTLDLSAYSQVELSFDILDFFDETHDSDGLYFSETGAADSFVKVYDFRPGEWCDNTYGKFPPFDVDALAAANGLSLTSQFVIRFQQYDDSDFSTADFSDRDGFYLDNVEVRVSPIQYKTLPFNDDFEAESLDSAWSWVHPANTALPNTIKPTGFVALRAAAALDDDQGLQIGKICDDGFTTNAIDLHLNIENESDVKLSFDILDFYNEPHNEDGLYFSDDGGSTFTKVYTFRVDDWCDNTYGKFPPFDVDALAAANGLSLTSQFVIRFQQYDDADFLSGGDRDGFFLDNVEVRVSPTQYASLPFTDDFETGTLGSEWSWAFPEQTAPANTIKPTGWFGFTDNRQGGAYQIYLGKRCDDGFTTNAIDLNLNLEDQSQIEISFDINDFFNENHDEDGIYFSGDGGQNFTKIYTFDFDELPDNTYTNITFQIDTSFHNIDFSDSSVIRFQQYDDADFISGGDRDGLYLDNVRVGNPILPTITAFEPGIGPIGKLITLSGSNFNGATSVQFNGVEASFTVFDSAGTILRARVPQGASRGKISVTNAEGTTISENDFIVSTSSIATPYDLRGNAEGNIIQLVWQDSATNETGFEVWRKSDTQDNWAVIAEVDTNITTYRDGNVTKDSVYNYSVRAFNTLGFSDFTESTITVTATGGSDAVATIPTAPSDLEAVGGNQEETRINLSWADNSDNEIGFRIYRRLEGGSFEEVAIVPANTNSYTDIGLDFDTQYFYIVRAYNSAGESADSEEADATSASKILSINDLAETEGLRLYPVPTGEVLHLEMANETYGEVEISLLNQMGQVVATQKLDKKSKSLESSFDLNGLSKGVYFLRITQQDEVKVQRVLKE